MGNSEVEGGGGPCNQCLSGIDSKDRKSWSGFVMIFNDF